ncbi:unnamed protein product [Leptidea sinapis]|uniref:Sensory neuron membrane protein 2 n=1 Tax=Leptidea sinapis TaxID=189913 RepID=A0A5E4PPD4_9NEOP|nr:unnamed protein product [Leptidea sinapis]
MLGKNAKIFFLGSVCLLIASIILAAWGFPKIVGLQIQKSVQIENSSLMFEKWRKLPMPLTFNVYLFNVTNVQDINSGMKPLLQEVGPFVYKEYRERTILGYGENDTVRYTLKKTFVFDKEASGNLTDDVELTVINYPYMAAILTANSIMPSIVGLLNSAMGPFFSSEQDPFLKVRVNQLLFDGVYLNCSRNSSALALICGKLKADKPPTMRLAEDRSGFYFSMFAHMNNTDIGPFEMNRGVEDVRQLGHITSFQDMTVMNQWGDPYCGMINGSDATIFPPIDEKNVPNRLYIYEPEICRSIFASLVDQRVMFNMTTYYYEVDKMALASKSANPDNKCFCDKNWSSNHDGCLMMGLINLKPCKNAPVIGSFPHFHLASEELLNYFAGGIKPDPEKHNSFVYLEPTTGVVLKGFQRLQFNIELRQIPMIPQLENVTSGLFPLMWVEEGATIPDDLLEELQDSRRLLDYVETARWMLLVIATFSCIIAAVCVVRSTGAHVWPRRSDFHLRPGNTIVVNKSR